MNDTAAQLVADAKWILGADSPDRAVATEGLILSSIVGSTLHGLSVSDGVEDLDIMGICCEPPERALGLRPFEGWIGRTKPAGVRSEAGDIDMSVYGLRKWARLALQGNPTVLLPLYAPQSHLLVLTPLGRELRALAPAFASRQAGKRFLGYAIAQRERLEGTRGQLRVHRPELVDKFGWDCKFGYQMLRLGYQGIEYLTTGGLELPVQEPARSQLLAVRTGKVTKEDVLAVAASMEADLACLIDTSPLPEYPDEDVVERWLVSAYRRAWDGRAECPTCGGTGLWMG